MSFISKMAFEQYLFAFQPEYHQSIMSRLISRRRCLRVPFPHPPSRATFKSNKMRYWKPSHPHERPITSIMNVLWWEDAVLTIESIASRIRWSAESAPIVMSVPLKSLSIDATIPTRFKCAHVFEASSFISPTRVKQLTCLCALPYGRFAGSEGEKRTIFFKKKGVTWME